MQNFTMYSPTKVLFGKQTELSVGAEISALGAKKVLLLYGGQSAKKSGLIARVEQSLQNAGIAYTNLSGVQPNPRLSLVYEGIELCKKEGVDFILAVGGGSVIDSAKAIGVGVLDSAHDVWDHYFIDKVPVEKCMPIGVILTIAAAGSETSHSCVISHEEKGLKRSINCDPIRPRFAIMNPELTMTLPVHQIACGVVDIMMHTMDRYFTPTKDNELTDAIAEGLLKTVIRNGLCLVINPKDYNASSEVMWAGSLSHNGLTGCGYESDFATHQLGHELSAMYDIYHGDSLSAVWGSWARYVYKVDVMRFAQYASNVWDVRMDYDNPEKTALQGIEATERFFALIDMPTSFHKLSCGVVDDKTVEQLAYMCSYKKTREIGSFRALDYYDILEIYKMANK